MLQISCWSPRALVSLAVDNSDAVATQVWRNYCLAIKPFLPLLKTHISCKKFWGIFHGKNSRHPSKYHLSSGVDKNITDLSPLAGLAHISMKTTTSLAVSLASRHLKRYIWCQLNVLRTVRPGGEHSEVDCLGWTCGTCGLLLQQITLDNQGLLIIVCWCLQEFS